MKRLLKNLTLVCFAVILCTLVVNANISSSNPASGSCLCVAGNGVNVRSTACGAVLGQVDTGRCYKYKGNKRSCTLSGPSYNFFNVEYGSGGWIAGNYLILGSASQCSTAPPANCPKIISRAGWGARAPTSTSNLRHPVPRFFVHHTAGAACTTESACITQVRGIQNLHMNTNGWADIGYNFLVGEDGNVYEGRGWDHVGAHATNWNSVAIGVVVIGTYTNRNPNQAALNAVKQLIQCGISLGKLSSSYSLHGHRDGVCTECPGDTLYNTIKTWPHYGGRLSGGCASG